MRSLWCDRQRVRYYQTLSGGECNSLVLLVSSGLDDGGATSVVALIGTCRECTPTAATPAAAMKKLASSRLGAWLPATGVLGASENGRFVSPSSFCSLDRAPYERAMV